MLTKKDYNGISLRTIHYLLIVCAVFLSVLVLYSTFFVSSSFENLAATTERSIEMRKAAHELMDASDYLTEKVQRFTINGEMKYLQEYYNEAFVLQRREEAVDKMSASPSGEALESLQSAMDSSKQLMEMEYYAFRLVLEAKGYDESTYRAYPLPLQDVVLSDADMALSADEKMQRAKDIVFSDEYYNQKQQIHDSMQASLDVIEKQVNESDRTALELVRKRLIVLRIVLVLETVGVFLLVWLASILGIHPILKAVERIKNGNKIPESGTSEFRYLVRAYNMLYESYKQSMERLSFKASHDELTGVYNRAGYDSLISSIDLSSTYMFLFDVDNFKSINDTYGHETGDKVLVKLANTLKRNFRPDDFICRVGGDEFVVLMLHSPEKMDDMVASKIDAINKQLEETEDGLPTASISVGIVHGSEADGIDELFEKTDSAMYTSKQKGKKTYTIYNA